jgi:predicted nucleotidyltransferase
MTDYAVALRALIDGGVRFLVVGGAAATAHGSARLTHDLDLLYARDRPNLERLARAIAPHRPYPRGVPPGLGFQLDSATLAGGLNFALTTRMGDLDLHGEIPGWGGYQALLPHAIPIDLYARTCLCLDLPALIGIKRAAGRSEDLEAIAELEVLLEETAGQR